MLEESFGYKHAFFICLHDMHGFFIVQNMKLQFVLTGNLSELWKKIKENVCFGIFMNLMVNCMVRFDITACNINNSWYFSYKH